MYDWDRTPSPPAYLSWTPLAYLWGIQVGYTQLYPHSGGREGERNPYDACGAGVLDPVLELADGNNGAAAFLPL